MNHRELILSAQKKPKFGFLALPEDLQDEIVDGLDSGTLAMREASEMVKARGKSLSHESIAAYYRAVRRERSIYDTDGHKWTRMEGAEKESIRRKTSVVFLLEKSSLLKSVKSRRCCGITSFRDALDFASCFIRVNLCPSVSKGSGREVEKALGVRQ